MRRGLLLPLLLVLACVAADAQEPPRQPTVPLTEPLLKRFEALSQQLPGQLRADPALKADFKSVEKDQAPPGGAPGTVDGLNALMASRHPRLTAALAADGWKPGEFYAFLGTLMGAEAAAGSPKHAPPNKRAGENVAFVKANSARVDAAVTRFNKGMQ